MFKLFPHIFLVSSFFSLGVAGYSQTLSISAGNSFYSADQYQSAHAMFAKARTDLNQLTRTPETVTAQQELAALEQNWNLARYDSRQMANTILQLRAATNQTGLTMDDRNQLTADLSRLIEFQNEYY